MLTLIDMFKALKLEKHKDIMYRIMSDIEPSVRVELINYLIKN